MTTATNPKAPQAKLPRYTNDRIVGKDGERNDLWGDAQFDITNARGGNDQIIGGNGLINSAGQVHIAENYLFGDAGRDLNGTSWGGNDSIHGGSNAGGQIHGDALFLSGYATGGTGYATGGNDKITVGNNTSYEIFGDGYMMYGDSQGGNDVIFGGQNLGYNFFSSQENFNQFWAYGDAYSMQGNSKGGNDVIVGADDQASSNFYDLAVNVIYGESADMTANTRAGDDQLRGGKNAYNVIIGEASLVVNDGTAPLNVLLGNDSITGGSLTVSNGIAINELIGDAEVIDATQDGDFAKSGNDLLKGGDGAFNTMFGDAYEATGNVKLGDDVIYGGNSYTFQDWDVVGYYGEGVGFYGSGELFSEGVGNVMIGDVFSAGEGVTFGNDRLISGAFADDVMYGDAVDGRSGLGGADVFVFAANNGNDKIMDFEVGHDKIDLGAFDIMSWADMQARLSDDGEGNTIIDLGNGNNVVLEDVDYTTLTANDFVIG